MRVSVLIVVVVGVVLCAGSPPVFDKSLASSPVGMVWLVQVPYAPPPEAEFPDIPKATPGPEFLTPEEAKRAELLLPMLSGPQELYAIGEFVHLGKPAVPVIIKALMMPDTRVRYNAIETLKIIKVPSSVPALLESAMNVNEVTRIRAHALRTAVRIDPRQVLPALEVIDKDDTDTMRRTVAFEARYVRQKEVIPILIEMLGDSERFVAVTALESFWMLTRYAGKPHDWQGSTQEQRKVWALEWKEWWETNSRRREQESQASPKAMAKSKKGQGRSLEFFPIHE